VRTSDVATTTTVVATSQVNPDNIEERRVWKASPARPVSQLLREYAKTTDSLRPKYRTDR
jgi:UDP-3-O-[3-hydroxymyristoyl] glucosamine N-acyltransferase